MSQLHLNRREKVWLSLLMIAGSCVACRYPLPLVPRPDTRRIVAVQIDSTAMSILLRNFRGAFPNEVALCLTGSVSDTTFDGESRRVIHVTGAIHALADSADSYHVYFPLSPRTGCAVAHLVGAAHDHTQGGFPCTHSDPDANVLFNDPRLLVSLVFCGDGESEGLFQDGRRLRARWAPEL